MEQGACIMHTANYAGPCSIVPTREILVNLPTLRYTLYRDGAALPGRAATGIMHLLLISMPGIPDVLANVLAFHQ